MYIFKINIAVNNGDLRRYRAHCDVIVMHLSILRYTSAANYKNKTSILGVATILEVQFSNNPHKVSASDFVDKKTNIRS